MTNNIEVTIEVENYELPEEEVARWIEDYISDNAIKWTNGEVGREDLEVHLHEKIQDVAKQSLLYEEGHNDLIRRRISFGESDGVGEIIDEVLDGD